MILDHTSFEAESLGGNQGTERQECLVCKPSHLCVFFSRHASGCSRSGALICIIRRVRSRNLSINHTHALSFRKSGDPEPGTSWTRVCVKVVLPSSLYRPWRRAYRYGPDTGELSTCAKRGGRCHLSRVRKASDSDAYHSSSRRFESAAFALAMSARASTLGRRIFRPKD